MKKYLSILLTGILAAGLLLTACGGSNTPETPETSANGSGTVTGSSSETGGGMLAGGWTVSEPGASSLTEEEQAIFDQAKEGLLGVEYTPVAVLATQLVSGTNYAYLCSSKAVTPEAQPEWCVVVVYNNLQNEASVSSVCDIDLANIHTLDNVDTTQAVGAWEIKAPAEGAKLSDERAQEAFEKALEGFVGVGYTPIALLGTQVVAGTNYKILCYGQTVTAEPVSALYVVDVYEDLEGNAEISSAEVFDLLAYKE